MPTINNIIDISRENLVKGQAHNNNHSNENPKLFSKNPNRNIIEQNRTGKERLKLKIKRRYI
jgi:hypothetical protein